MSQWKENPQADALMQKLLREGQSASQIAGALRRELGMDVTRNAVIGRCHRRRLSSDESVAARREAKRQRQIIVARQTQVAKERARSEKERRRLAQLAAAERRSALREELADPWRVTETARPWLSRRFGECSYPVGQPDRPANQLSCCAEVEGESNYCRLHTDLMRSANQPANVGKIIGKLTRHDRVESVTPRSSRPAGSIWDEGRAAA